MNSLTVSTYNDPVFAPAYAVRHISTPVPTGERRVSHGNHTTYLDGLSPHEKRAGYGGRRGISPVVLIGAAVLIYFVFIRKS